METLRKTPTAINRGAATSVINPDTLASCRFIPEGIYTQGYPCTTLAWFLIQFALNLFAVVASPAERHAAMTWAQRRVTHH
jgi:hypothetical protein